MGSASCYKRKTPNSQQLSTREVYFLTQAYSDRQGVGKTLLHAVMQEPRLPEVLPSSALASKVTLGVHIQLADE